MNRTARCWTLGMGMLVSCGRTVPEGVVDDAASSAAMAPTRATEETRAAGEIPDPRPACPSWADLKVEALPPLPPGRHVDSFARVFDLVRTRHPDPTLNCVDWIAAWTRVGGAVARAPTTEAAYQEINGLLEMLGESHMHAWPPAAPGERGARPSGPRGRPDIEFVVTPSGARLAGARARARGVAGRWIVAVDGVPLGVWMGRAQAVHGTRDVVRRRRALDEALSCHVGNSHMLTHASSHNPSDLKAQPTIEVPCEPVSGPTLSFGHLRDIDASVHHTYMPSAHTGIVTFRAWMLPMVPRIRAAVDALRRQGMQRLIFDLRGNPGGVGAMVIPVGRMLLRETTSMGTLTLRDHVQDLKVFGDAAAFDGAVNVLVDEATASTSEIFAAGLRDLGRASVIGAETSAGMALPSIIERLPDGGAVQIVVGHHASPGGGAPEGDGLPLDHQLRVVDRDFQEVDDPVLRAAIAWRKAR